MTRQVVDRLQADGHEVVLEDLYAEGFNAALSEVERASGKGFKVEKEGKGVKLFV